MSLDSLIEAKIATAVKRLRDEFKSDIKNEVARLMRRITVNTAISLPLEDQDQPPAEEGQDSGPPTSPSISDSDRFSVEEEPADNLEDRWDELPYLPSEQSSSSSSSEHEEDQEDIDYDDDDEDQEQDENPNAVIDLVGEEDDDAFYGFEDFAAIREQYLDSEYTIVDVEQSSWAMYHFYDELTNLLNNHTGNNGQPSQLEVREHLDHLLELCRDNEFVLEDCRLIKYHTIQCWFCMLRNKGCSGMRIRNTDGSGCIGSHCIEKVKTVNQIYLALFSLLNNGHSETLYKHDFDILQQHMARLRELYLTAK